MNKKSLGKIQKQAEEWVKEAGKILQKYQGKAKIKKRKSDFGDVVTEADLFSEQFLIKKIKHYFPDHNILSEEAGRLEKNSQFLWIIDPLGGTKEYVKGLPSYHVSIALEHKKRILLGVVFRPRTGELFSATARKGFFLNGIKKKVSSEESLERSTIYSHLPNYKTPEEEFQNTWKIFQKITKKIYRLRTVSEDVVALARLGQGAFEGFILTLFSGNWWDFAPGLLMVEEAGGKVTDIYGNRIKNRNLSKGIVASNGKIHDKLLEFFKT